MKRAQTFLLSLVFLSLSFFHVLVSKKSRVWFSGTKNLAPLLRVVFRDNNGLEGKELIGKIESLNRLRDQVAKKTLPDGEKIIFKEIKALMYHFKETKDWEEQGHLPSSRVGKIKEGHLANIKLLCEQNSIVLHTGKKKRAT